MITWSEVYGGSLGGNTAQGESRVTVRGSRTSSTIACSVAVRELAWFGQIGHLQLVNISRLQLSKEEISKWKVL